MIERYYSSETARSEVIRPPETPGHNSIVIITGVSGVGKDFLLIQMRENGLIPDGISVLNMGTLLSRQAGIDRDRLREGTLDEVSTWQQAVLPEILRLQPAVLITHMVVKQGNFLIVNPKLEFSLAPKWYVCVISHPKQIIEWRRRRNTKGERNTVVEDPVLIEFHQRMVVDTLLNLHRLTGAGVAVVNNLPDTTRNNLELMKEIFSSLVK